MFTTLDARTANTARACDQCKIRKVKCNFSKPCTTCDVRGLVCSYEHPRKRRGPAGKRIAEIQRHQKNLHGQGDNNVFESAPGNDLQGLNVSRSDQTSLDPAYQERNMSLSSYESRSWPASHASTSPQDNVSPYPGLHDQRTESTAGRPLGLSTTRGSLLQPDTRSLERNGSDIALLLNPDTSHETEIVFPSLPIESPACATMDDAFGSIQQEDLPRIQQKDDVWPSIVNEQTLLPWIDVYFKRLHPTIPILNRPNLYCEMLLRKHRTDPQYGAMLLSLAAFAMEQPVQIHEQAMKASRSVQSRMLLQECAKMRVAANFGEEPTVDMILTSFFMFACLFGSGEHKAARHRLREAVDLAFSLGLHLPQSYQDLSPEVREKWLRTYLVLSVTERAYALQQNHVISFRGRPGITARFMQAFDVSMTNEYIASLIFPDQDVKADAVSMTGLLYLMDSFDAIDEVIMDCWNGYCRSSDGICDSFDRRRALQMFRAQYRVREGCLTGNISYAPSVTPVPLSQLLESQQADISITQIWLLNRLWLLCFSHGLIREDSEHRELRYDFSAQLAHATLNICESLSLAAMEVHGLGFLMKIYDIAMGLVTALQSSANLNMDTPSTSVFEDVFPGCPISLRTNPCIQTLLEDIGRLMKSFRGGDHHFNGMLDTAVSGVMGLT